MGGQVPLEFGPVVQPGPGVQRGQRLVEQQQCRFDGQRPGQRHPLRLPAGELPGFAPGLLGQPHPVQPAGGQFAGAPPVYAVPAGPEGDVVQREQVRKQQVVLEHHAARATFGRRPVPRDRPVELLAGEGDMPGVQRSEAGKRTQRRPEPLRRAAAPAIPTRHLARVLPTLQPTRTDITKSY
ncbi:hypothetical protein Pen02_82030 [Plantactinospora endophytica]|uniref:Uncharacterized protein n=1 Tax=Plantactinospora endophytica TaxID=673535 RepID=A0ABQ4EEW2_9ACTN|nr:hypothetical protein Pen02_82030 [Plantactinospora endophytica]